MDEYRVHFTDDLPHRFEIFESGWHIVLYRDGLPLSIVGSDGGEPEDQIFVRDLDWIAPALNDAYRWGRQERAKGARDEERRLQYCFLCLPWRKQIAITVSLNVLTDDDRMVEISSGEALFKTVLKRVTTRGDTLEFSNLVHQYYERFEKRKKD